MSKKKLLICVAVLAVIIAVVLLVLFEEDSDGTYVNKNDKNIKIVIDGDNITMYSNGIPTRELSSSDNILVSASGDGIIYNMEEYIKE